MASIPPLRTQRPVHRHVQDTPTNCGRACAQMIISSLTQGPLPGSLPSPADKSSPIAVEQSVLQRREAPNDVDNTATPSWYTHPDELHHLLQNAPELAPGSSWHVSAHATLDPLIADVVLALQNGLPSVINLRVTDHWAVVIGAQLNEKGQLSWLHVLDPLWPPNAPTHSYVDICDDSGGYADPWIFEKGQFGAFEMEIGKVPNPAGMQDYQGQYVGIVPGVAPSPDDLGPLAEKLKMPRERTRQQTGTSPGAPNHAALITELTSIAAEVESPELAALISSQASPIVRTVRDIRGSGDMYTLLSLFNDQLRYGVIAAFDPYDHRLMHFRFVTVPLLSANTDEVLWWTREFLPSLPSPYFPFREEVGAGGPSFKRLVDDFRFSPSSARRGR